MSSERLTDRIKREVSQTSLDVCDWIDSKLSEDGPWHSKATEKESINCLMRYHLGNTETDNSDICQYLNNDDEDEAWVKSIANHVAPVVIQHCR